MKTFQNFVRVLSITSVIFLAKAGVVFITMQGSALAYGGADDYEDSRSLTLGNCGESRDCPEIVVTGYRSSSTDAYRNFLRESWRVQAMEQGLCSRVSQREQNKCEQYARLIGAGTFAVCGGGLIGFVVWVSGGIAVVVPGAIPVLLGACGIASNAVSEYGIAECESEAALTRASRGCGTSNGV